MKANGSDDDRTKSFIALTAGIVVSHYRIISKIGAGGMGEVYLAEDTELNRKVALKFLPQHLCQDEDYRARFKREAQAAAALKHPNIVTIYEVSEYNGRPYIAMEHVEGTSLRDKIKDKKLSINEAVELTIQICEGLHEAHESGIVHRDIKPGNIIVDNKNRPHILDFGLAQVAGETKLTKTGSTLGTIGYMSPEQIKGAKSDHRSDIFSVGVILYEMITGKSPFEAEHEAAIQFNIINEQPEPMSRYKSGVSGELQQIIDKALIKDPSMRYQHADGMLADLKRLKAESIPSKKSRTGWLITAAVVIFALIVYFVIDSLSFHKEASKQGWTNSVAVLVFRNLSSDPEQDYFCEGMTDEIIGRLSTIKNLKVTSMQSMLRFKGTDLDLKQIGKELGVDNILEGSIQRDGDNIRVRAQLIRAKDDAHIWTNKYEQELTSIFAIQDEISRSIAEVLEATLVGNEPSFVSRRGTDNIEAYNAYIRGRHFWRMRNAESIEKSIQYFNKAIALDSGYALAWSGLADAWLTYQEYGNISLWTTIYKADTLSLKALTLDDRLAETHISRANALFERGDTVGIEEMYLKAIEINPGYSWAYHYYGRFLRELGRSDEAVPPLQKALELDPLSLPTMALLSWEQLKRQNYTQVEEYCRRQIDIEPNYMYAYSTLADVCMATGDTDRALSLLDSIHIGTAGTRSSWEQVGHKLQQIGHFDEAEDAFRMAIHLAPDVPLTYYKYGVFLQDLDRKQEAEEQFKHAIELDMVRGVMSLQSYWQLVLLFESEGQKKEAIEMIDSFLVIGQKTDISNIKSFLSTVKDMRERLERD